MKRNKRIKRLSQDFEDKHLKTSSYRPKIQHASFQPTAGAADRSAHSAGPCLEELLGQWVEGVGGSRKWNCKERARKKSENKELQGSLWVSKGFVFRGLGGPWGVTLGTPGATLGT